MSTEFEDHRVLRIVFSSTGHGHVDEGLIEPVENVLKSVYNSIDATLSVDRDAESGVDVCLEGLTSPRLGSVHDFNDSLFWRLSYHRWEGNTTGSSFSSSPGCWSTPSSVVLCPPSCRATKPV